MSRPKNKHYIIVCPDCWLTFLKFMLFQSVMKGIIENGVPVKFNPRISVWPHVNFVFIDRVIVIIGHLMLFVPKNRVGDRDLFNEFSICLTQHTPIGKRAQKIITESQICFLYLGRLPRSDQTYNCWQRKKIPQKHFKWGPGPYLP